jgi:hypothetical protein
VHGNEWQNKKQGFQPNPGQPSCVIRVITTPDKQSFDMKKSTFILFSAVLLMLFSAGCLKDKCKNTQTYTIWKPVVKSLDEIRVQIANSTPVPLKNPGKIYIYNQWLFIGEAGEGIHIFDNSNPDAPQNVSFISLPGNVDMAVMNGYLYADNYIDMVVLDISNPLRISLVNRLENVFPYASNGQGGYIINYIQTTETQTIDCNSINYNKNYYAYEDDVAVLSNSVPYAFAGTNTAPVVGTGSSQARFTIANNYLYTVDSYTLRAFDLQDPANPSKTAQPINIGFTLETLFAFGNTLFVGSSIGMYMYDISNNPGNPDKLGQFTHAWSCDPVVTDGQTAFITLHDGTTCNGTSNELDVVDVHQLTSPVLISTFPMKRPLGLGVRDNLLFLCDDGFKVFDKTDLYNIDQHMLSHLTDVQPTDVIPVPNSTNLILVSPSGIYQYDAANPSSLRQRSIISIQK